MSKFKVGVEVKSADGTRRGVITQDAREAGIYKGQFAVMWIGGPYTVCEHPEDLALVDEEPTKAPVFDGNAPVRVVTVSRSVSVDYDTMGMLVEIPAMHSSPGKVIRSTDTVVVRAAWPREYHMPLGTEVPAGAF